MQTQNDSPDSPVHLFVDLANVVGGARCAAELIGEDPRAVRVDASALFRLMAAGRPVASAILVVNSGVPESVLGHWRPLFQVLKVESGVDSGLDQAADEILQNRMFLAFMQPGPVGTIVVATGDGAGWRRGIGFIPTLTAARRVGFGVEVLSFRDNLNPQLRAIAEDEGVLVELDPYYDGLTFIEGFRWRREMRLHHRPTSAPDPLEAGYRQWSSPLPAPAPGSVPIDQTGGFA
jgi:hypothetical protein